MNISRSIMALMTLFLAIIFLFIVYSNTNSEKKR